MLKAAYVEKSESLIFTKKYEMVVLETSLLLEIKEKNLFADKSGLNRGTYVVSIY